MIKSIIDFSIRDRFMVLMATFLVAAVGIWAYLNAPLDAIPDLSDVQVIVLTEYPGQAPQVVEDQVTYPLTTAMLAVPKAPNETGARRRTASWSRWVCAPLRSGREPTPAR